MTPSTATGKRPYAPRMATAERREQLLDAALDIISTNGVAAVSVDSVAKACGVTRPVVYGQFTDANHILRDLLSREGERALAQVAAVLPTDFATADPVETFTHVAAGFFAAVTVSPQRWRSILLPVDGVPAPVGKYKRQGEAAVRARIAEITRWFIRDEPDAGEIDVDLLAHILLTAMEEGGRLVLDDPETYPPERLTAMARFMVETFFNRTRRTGMTTD